MKIGFIGAGNMGGAILRGALSKGIIKSSDTCVFGVNKEKLEKIGLKLGVTTYDDISTITKDCDVLLLGTKPQIFDEVLPQVANGLDCTIGYSTEAPFDTSEKSNNASTTCGNKIIVSMAAGISISYIEKSLGTDCKIIRIMPNTPAKVGEAMTSISRNANVTDDELLAVSRIFSGIGKCVEVPEDQIHCVIGVSGSSPAYTYLYIDALAKTAEKNGMTREKALEFASQAVLGAAKMVLETGIDPSILCDNVCSPGGTTIEAVKVLKENDFDGLIAKAFQATVDKSIKISK